MNTPQLHVAVQYTRKVAVHAHVRPYQNNLPLSNSIELWLDVTELPEADHWRVELEAEVLGKTSQGTVCLEATAAIEAIVVVSGMDATEVQDALRYNVGGALMGSLRVLLANASATTGYGTITLPPIDSTRLASLPAKQAVEAQISNTADETLVPVPTC